MQQLLFANVHVDVVDAEDGGVALVFSELRTAVVRVNAGGEPDPDGEEQAVAEPTGHSIIIPLDAENVKALAERLKPKSKIIVAPANAVPQTKTA